MLKKQEKKIRRHKRVRAKVFGTKEIPRLCVFRSHQHIYAQLIDDEKGNTIVEAQEKEIKKPDAGDRKAKTALAYAVGKLVAERALEKKIKKIVFDRGGYKYHGRVKALAEGAREAGLKF
jgi:large subunit ribosomal protein L18